MSFSEHSNLVGFRAPHGAPYTAYGGLSVTHSAETSWQKLKRIVNTSKITKEVLSSSLNVCVIYL